MPRLARHSGLRPGTIVVEQKSPVNVFSLTDVKFIEFVRVENISIEHNI
jgi:hypothetical protein